MNRKDRLKLTSTPDRKMKNIYQSSAQQKSHDLSDQHISNNEIEDDYYVDSIDDSLFTPPNSTMRVLYDNFKWVCSYLKYVLPYGIVVYFLINNFYSINNNTVIDVEISDLTKEIDLLKQESAKMAMSAVEKPYNICKIEHCTTIQLNRTDLYLHGFIGMRKSIDPSIIFGENAAPGDCLAFLPNEREFTIKFSKNAIIDNFHIFHPETGNKKSAIREFILKGFYNDKEYEIGRFIYDINKENCQTFSFPEIITDRLVIRILNNNGHKSYTTVYKVYALGIFN